MSINLRCPHCGYDLRWEGVCVEIPPKMHRDHNPEPRLSAPNTASHPNALKAVCENDACEMDMFLVGGPESFTQLMGNLMFLDIMRQQVESLPPPPGLPK